jgi:PHP family Zn ribbon phosphoesterase
MADPRDYKLDISGLSQNDAANPQQGRPYLRVQFRCCNAYQRIYRSADGKTYNGRCPKCARPVKFVVGEGGTSCRDFIVE